MGGWTLQGQQYMTLNDIWSSPDGVNWTRQVAAAPWFARGAFAALVFDNRMWVIGGWNPGTFNMNDVWSSVDGINWVLEAQAPWVGRAGHTAVVYRGRMWVLGGNDSIGTKLNDMWSSVDGKNWVRETSAAPWLARTEHASVVYRDRIWVLGGTTNTFMNDVWSYGFHMFPTDLAGGLIDVPYSATIGAKEGDGPYTWSMTGGALPPGLSMGSSTTDSVPITGTPTALGTYTFTVKVTDSTGNFDEQVVTLTITKINQAGTGASPGCAAAPNGLLTAPLAATAALALFALTPRRRRALNKPA